MEAASHLVTQAQRQPGRFGSCYIADAAQAERLRSAAAQTRTKALQAAIAAGIGFHNAAMEPEDRLLVRRLQLELCVKALQGPEGASHFLLCSAKLLARGLL
jgi:ATP-dependent DNA helicase HFM1/MER3